MCFCPGRCIRRGYCMVSIMSSSTTSIPLDVDRYHVNGLKDVSDLDARPEAGALRDHVPERRNGPQPAKSGDCAGVRA